MASLWFIPLFVQLLLLTSRVQVEAGKSFDGVRDDNKQFQWRWRNDGIQFLLPSCAQLDIEVKPWDPVKNDTHGVPPYYMMSFPIGGTPVTTWIGDDPAKLSWQPTHAPGTRTVLTIVDSTGSFGGVPSNIFTITDTLSTACVVPEPTEPNFTITSNITKPLETCEPWGIRIKGGVPPYNVTIAAVGSPIITNVSFASGFDAYTYTNRADPNGQLIFGLSDFTGRWASGVPLVNTTGSTNIDCPGRVSQPGIQSQLDQEERDRRAASNKKRTAIIAGVTVPVVLIVLAGIGFGVWWYLRRKKQQKPILEAKEVEPFSYQEEPLHLPAGRYHDSTGYSGQSKAHLASTNGHNSTGAGSLSYTSGGPPTSPSIHGSFAASTAYTSQAGHSSTTGAGSTRPLTGKAAEAAQAVVLSPDSEFNHASGSGMNGEEIVIQHRDAGPSVRELPPPYADRSLDPDQR
ncbi:hypothetical protein NMY22_g15167 [Coprinellus aureogranulatus]|nr:hypothetical protein NMY22_g15167 [Coprinellus aureogranulatus]